MWTGGRELAPRYSRRDALPSFQGWRVVGRLGREDDWPVHGRQPHAAGSALPSRIHKGQILRFSHGWILKGSNRAACAFPPPPLGQQIWICLVYKRRPCRASFPPRPVGQNLPLALFAELPSAHVVDGAQAELIGARRGEAAHHHPVGLRMDVGEEHRPRSVWQRKSPKSSTDDSSVGLVKPRRGSEAVRR